jgi:dTDP-4-amino-4,6-dideoxygalactose transaminase/predicted nucleic acid-binding protein
MKYYLDTSSLIKIYHPEEGSMHALELYRADAIICISELAVLEFLSTIHRRYREKEINSSSLEELLLKFQEDIDIRYELLPFSPFVFEEASRFVKQYGKARPVRTLDSLQLGFFSTYCDTTDTFVCSDKRLSAIGQMEGILVLIPTEKKSEKMMMADRNSDVGPHIFLSPPHLGEDEIQFVQKAFKSNYIAPLGPMVDAFEREFSEYTGIRHCAALASGTAAMHLGLRYLGGGPGDEVFGSTLTFIGSVTPVTFLGGTPVFIDCDRETWNMDPVLLEAELERCAKAGKLPKAVAPTDLYGQCCDYARIYDVCQRYGVPVVMDAAEAMGAKYFTQRRKDAKDKDGVKSGISEDVQSGSDPATLAPHDPPPATLNHAGKGARAAVFSFNGNKIMTTSGGGMLASDDGELIEKARFWSQQAREPFAHYEHTEIGCNYRMSNILAAIGRGQLAVLDERVQRKREIFDHYRAALGGVSGIEFMPEAAYGRCNRWLTVVLITPEIFGADREAVRHALNAENIESRPVWKPMHLQPVFDCSGQWSDIRGQQGKQRYPARVVGGKVAEDLFERGLCLPSGTAMTNSDLDRVIDIILKCRKV